MASVELPTGETLEFDDKATDDQIHFAVQDYLNKQSNAEQSEIAIQPQIPTQNQKPQQYSAFTENFVRPVARATKNAAAGTIGFAGDLAQQAINLPGYLGNKATQFVTGNQNARPFKPLSNINTASPAVRQAFDSITNDLTVPRNPAEQKIDQYSEMAAGGLAGGAKTIPQALSVAGGIAGNELSNKAADLLNIQPDSAVRTGLNVAGGLAGGISTGLSANKIQNFAKDYKVRSTLPKASKVVLNDIEKAGLTPEQVISSLKSDGGIGLDPIDVIPGQSVNIDQMGQIAASRKVLESALDRREQNLSKAINNITKNVQPDESSFSNLSQKFIDNLMSKRSATSKPLYKAAYEQTPPLSPQTSITSDDGNTRTLGNLLQNPTIQKAIQDGKNAAARYKGTSGMKFYNDLLPDTPPNDLRALHNAQTILKDDIGKIGLTGASQEQAATKALRDDLLKFMDEASPLYKEARNNYSIDTQEILNTKKGVVGILANLNSEKYSNAGKKIFSYSPNEIAKVKQELMKIDATKYQQGIKTFINQKIDDLGDKSLNELFRKPIEREKILAMLPDSAKSGFDKFIKYADQTRPVNDALRNLSPIASDSLEQSIPQKNIASSIGKSIGYIAKPVENVGVGIAEKTLGKNLAKKTIDPQQSKLLTNYLFTDEGMQNLQQLSKLSKKSEIDAAIRAIKSRAIIQTPLILNAEQNSDGS
ncbi:MAG: hypothetical protein EBS06_05465 [Proteobacteria bacterium]|nr:hypothetical protein [Pseudomonadota bacterium]